MQMLFGWFQYINTSGDLDVNCSMLDSSLSAVFCRYTLGGRMEHLVERGSKDFEENTLGAKSVPG